MIIRLKSAVYLALLCCLLFSCAKKTGSPDEKVKQPASKTLVADTSGIWKDIDLPPPTDNGTIQPDKFRLLMLDLNGMKKILSAAPKEKDKQNRPGIRVNIPLPEGTCQVFEVYETEVMAPELAAKFPEIKSFGGNGLTDKTMSIRMDYSPNGFHAFVITLKGGVNIDPYSRPETNKYICYYKQEFNKSPRQQMPVDSIK